MISASETCALDLIEATYEREVEPAKSSHLAPMGWNPSKPFPPAPQAKCIFEYVYFLVPTAISTGHNVYQVRKPSAGSWPRKRG